MALYMKSCHGGNLQRTADNDPEGRPPCEAHLFDHAALISTTLLALLNDYIPKTSRMRTLLTTRTPPITRTRTPTRKNSRSNEGPQGHGDGTMPVA